MKLNSRGMIDPENMARIEQAMVELASRELPKVWVGEPVRNGYGNLRGPKVDWYRLSEMNEEVGGDLLPPHVEQELFEESLHVVAAKRGLVTVKKFLPAYDMTVREHVGMLFALPPDRRFPRGSAYLIKFVAIDSLTRNDLPYIEDFLRRAADGPTRYVLEATDGAEFLAGILEDVDQS